MPYAATTPASLPFTLDSERLPGEWFYSSHLNDASTAALNKYPGPLTKTPQELEENWIGYTPEESVLIDCFRYSDKYLGTLLKLWADVYPFSAHIDYDSDPVLIRPSKIIVISQWHPSNIWHDDPHLLSCILRRFKVTQIFGEDQ